MTFLNVQTFKRGIICIYSLVQFTIGIITHLQNVLLFSKNINHNS